MTRGETSQPRAKPDAQSNTVQLLVANEGNRTVIRDMLADEFDVDTRDSVRAADLYLVEDRLLEQYRTDLRERIARDHPAFCPVVIIQRDRTNSRVSVEDTRSGDAEAPLLVDEFVRAPINRQLLVSRLRSLLVRRRQSLELQTQVETLARQERELRRFERAVEDSGTATAITDTEGVIEYANSEFEELTGYAESRVLGHTLGRFLTDESAEMIDESFWRTMGERPQWEGELLIERADDGRRITETSIKPISDDDGTNEGFVVVMPDITPRVEQEQLLRDREQELELLRQILSRHLRHNLRNDLNIILGYTDLLAAKIPKEDVPDAEKIREAANRLIDRSETARKYSSLIEREAGPTVHNLSEVAAAVVSDVRERYPDVSIETDIPADCRVLAGNGISEALRELIDNAARHNTAESPRVRVTATGSEGARVVIEDNGPGIPDLELETLNRESETALKHSQGIGLWLSKWVIEKGDGQLLFETTPEGGTRVTIDFPPAEGTGGRDAALSDLKAREQRLRTITQRMTDAVIEVNASWEITYADAHAETILDVDSDRIRWQHFWDVFPDLRDTRFETVYRRAMQSRSAGSLEEYYSGIDGWLEAYAYPDFDGGLSFYFRDITRRKARERELERASSRMELALEATDAAVWELDIETESISFHPKRHPVLGPNVRTVEEFIDRIHPADRPRVEDAFARAVKTGAPYDVEYRVQVDGETRWATAYGEVQYDDGEARRITGVVRDITERKEREAELELKGRAMDEAPVGITISDPGRDDNPLIYANDHFKELTGYADSESLGRNCRFLQGENTDEEPVRRIREAIDAGDPVTVELRNYRKDGTEFWSRVSIAPIRTEDGDLTHFVGFQEDVTERTERDRLFEAIFDNAYTSIGVLDPDGTVVEANETALSRMGADRADVVGDAVWETPWFRGGSDAAETVKTGVEVAKTGKLFRDEIRLRNGEGTMTIDVTVRPVFGEDDRVTRLVFEGRDVTDVASIE